MSLRKSSIKHSPAVGEGPCRAACPSSHSRRFPVLDTVRGLPAFPQIFEVWLQQRGNNAEAPLKSRGEQTEAGWLQCLSKVLIKPHSPSPTETKLNKQRLAGDHFLSSSPTASLPLPCSRYAFVIRGFRLTRQQRGNSARSHKVICAQSEGGSVSLWTQ